MKFIDFAAKKTLIFDGSMGTLIQSKNLPDSVWNGYFGNSEVLNITSPATISDIHRAYFRAGSDVAITNTFGGNSIVLDEFGLADKVVEFNTQAVQIAKATANEFIDKFVGLSVGPSSKLPTLSQISFDAMNAAYYTQIVAGAKAGIDFIIIETCQDLLQIKAAITAAMQVNTDLVMDIPILVSITVEENGKMLVGTDVACAAKVLAGYDIFSFGLNCGFGPDKMATPMAELAENWSGRRYLSANAGMPTLQNGKTVYNISPDDYATQAFELLNKYNLAAIGGCCGTNHEHIAKLSAKIGVRSAPVYTKSSGAGYICSAYTATTIRQSPAPAVIGERANATGSKAFREYLKAEDIDAMANIARQQQDSSHIIDLSIALPGRDEVLDMAKIVSVLNRELIAPLMIDSTSPEVVLTGLKSVTGKPVINSVNFEDGGARLATIMNMVKYYPAAVVALTIDENGMAQTKNTKLAVADRICDEWITRRNYPPEDLLIDFLTFSVASGDDSSKFAAVNTLEAIREFKIKFPLVNTVLGVSNISFGLSPAARTVLNSVFLDQAIKASLDTAIVHATKILPINSIDEEKLKLCNALLAGEDDALDAFIKHFEGVREIVAEAGQGLSPEESLFNKVVNGNADGVGELITTLLKTHDAAEILNDILLRGMQEVGRLFNTGKLLLPFVLKSAEVMKTCTVHLTPYLKAGASDMKGTVVLATVKGDVHDIGKNLVDIVLSGNGYNVINMGTKISGDDIVKAAIEHRADAVGMSGLLVKSTEIMKENIELLRANNLDVKVLLGGAALTADYVCDVCEPIMPGKVFYCKDAFAGVTNLSGEQQSATKAPKSKKELFSDNKWNIHTFDGSVTSEFYGTSEVTYADLLHISKYLHKRSLFEGKWGNKILSNSPDKEKQLSILESELDTMLNSLVGLVKPAYVYGFYPVECRNNELWITHNDVTSLLSSFPQGKNGECFTNMYITSSGQSIIPLQAVTLGAEASTYVTGLFKNTQFSKYYTFHGLLAELTEALAEAVQYEVSSKILINGEAMTKKALRYSFGYPICPDLAGNRVICEILNTKAMQMVVNESEQLEPIYSTCAMLSWHPESRYI